MSCILSRNKPTKAGYPRKWRDGRATTHHRVVYADHHGLDVYGEEMRGSEVDHLCGEPRCIRVDHLELVTPAENIRRSSRTRLNPVAVAVIRHLAASGVTQQKLAEAHGISQGSVSKIVRQTIWN